MYISPHLDPGGGATLFCQGQRLTVGYAATISLYQAGSPVAVGGHGVGGHEEGAGVTASVGL